MSKRLTALSVVVALGLWGLLIPEILGAAGEWKVVTGKTFDSALPKDFYLEGGAIPTQKRNAALLETANAARILLALIDTSGYSSQVQEKYIGMLITETPLSVCGRAIGVGSYGFGLKHPVGESAAPGEFILYDQAGHRVAACSAGKDMSLPHPAPLGVRVKGNAAELYLGRYLVNLKP